MKRIFLYTFFLIISCTSNESNTNNIDSLNNKWMLERSFLNNTEQNLSTCKKRSYIQFNTNNTFTRKDYILEGNVCQIEGTDAGNYTYNALTNRITLSYTDVDDGAIVEVLSNVNFTNTELFFSFDEDMNGVYEYNLEFIKE